MPSVTLEFEPARPVARLIFRSETGVPVLTADVRQQLDEALDRLEQDSSWRVLVLAAEGRTWLAGADIGEMCQFDPGQALAFSRAGQQRADRLAALPGVTVAAIHGPCFGGGTELALACQLRLLADAATMALPEVLLGVLPAWGGFVRCVEQLGTQTARWLILTGQSAPAAECLRLGLAQAVYPAEQFAAEVDSVVAQLLKAAPQAVQTARALLTQFGTPADRQRQLDAESRAFADCFRTGEPAEGMAAFLAKRPPAWPVSSSQPPAD